MLLTPDEASHAFWQALADRHNLRLLADLRSELYGTSTLVATSPILTGTITGLKRGGSPGGPTFKALSEKLAHVFDYDADQLRRYHLASAPVETTVDLARLARTLSVPLEGHKATWQPVHLSHLLDYLPQGKPLGVYGRGPNWLYAALTLHAHPAQFYQFDVRLGWITPPVLTLDPLPETAHLVTKSFDYPPHTHLEFTLTESYLDYEEAQGRRVPPISAHKGVLLSGKLPLWLWTALVLTYRQAVWLAVFQPQLNQQAVVVASQDESKPIGSLVTY